MLMRFTEPSEREEKESKIVLDRSLISNVTRMFEVKARGRVFDQCSIYEVFIADTEFPKQESELVVEGSLQNMILTPFQESCGLTIEPQSIIQSQCPHFDNASANEKSCFQFARLVTQTIQCA